MTQKLGFASAFYNQLENNNHFLDITFQRPTERIELYRVRCQLARLFRRQARSRSAANGNLYQGRTHAARGSQRQLQPVGRSRGWQWQRLQLLLELQQRILEFAGCAWLLEWHVDCLNAARLPELRHDELGHVPVLVPALLCAVGSGRLEDDEETDSESWPALGLHHAGDRTV